MPKPIEAALDALKKSRRDAGIPLVGLGSVMG
jgi:hypothetical protein